MRFLLDMVPTLGVDVKSCDISCYCQLWYGYETLEYSFATTHIKYGHRKRFVERHEKTLQHHVTGRYRWNTHYLLVGIRRLGQLINAQNSFQSFLVFFFGNFFA